MKKLRIIQTPARFYPYIGGVEKYVYDLSYQLVLLGHNVKVICAKEPKDNIHNSKGIEIKKLDYIGKIANTNITLSLFLNLLKEDFDVIHSHIPTPWSSDISLIVSLIKKKPLILTYHNDLVKDGGHAIIAKIYSKTFLKILFHFSKKIIITNSEYLKRSQYLNNYKNKIVVIPNGINIDNFDIKNNVKRNKYQLFFLSVLDEYHRYKGLDYLLESVVILKEKYPKTQLLIGGKGELINEYKKIVKKLNLEKNVKFLEFIPPNKLKGIYRTSSAFVLPSIDSNEGFGIVLLEAMASGTPVVATNIVGLAKDIIKYKCGLVVKPKDSEALADAITKIFINSHNASKMSLNSRILVEKKYSWNEISIQIEKIYREVIK